MREPSMTAPPASCVGLRGSPGGGEGRGERRAEEELEGEEGEDSQAPEEDRAPDVVEGPEDRAHDEEEVPDEVGGERDVAEAEGRRHDERPGGNPPEGGGAPRGHPLLEEDEREDHRAE